MDLKPYIREVADWPLKGVSFKDITPLLEKPRLLRYIIDQMAQPYKKQKVDKVAAIDARGFLLAAPIAYKLGSGVCLVRKKGKLPRKTIEESYQKEYGPDVLTMHHDTIHRGETVLIVDDVLATGGTVEAAVRLVERLGGKVAGISLLIDLPFLGGSQKLAQYKPRSLIIYETAGC